jgi:hypothetical protein
MLTLKQLKSYNDLTKDNADTLGAAIGGLLFIFGAIGGLVAWLTPLSVGGAAIIVGVILTLITCKLASDSFTGHLFTRNWKCGYLLAYRAVMNDKKKKLFGPMNITPAFFEKIAMVIEELERNTQFKKSILAKDVYEMIRKIGYIFYKKADRINSCNSADVAYVQKASTVLDRILKIIDTEYSESHSLDHLETKLSAYEYLGPSAVSVPSSATKFSLNNPLCRDDYDNFRETICN